MHFASVTDDLLGVMVRTRGGGGYTSLLSYTFSQESGVPEDDIGPVLGGN